MLVGRARELDEVEQLLEAASAGRGGLRVVLGAPGIGKTRLVDEIATRAAARGFAVGWGRAWETGGAPAYWPWLEVLGPLAETPAEVPAQVAALLGQQRSAPHGEGTRGDPARERFELFAAVSTFLRGCARGAPLLLVFDDLHAADLASLELLAFVARGLRGARVFVVATYRDAESRLEPVAEVLARIAREGSVLALRPLSGEEVAEVVRHDRGVFDGPLSAALFELSEGNPLFLHESLQAVAGSSTAPIAALRELSARGGVLAIVRSRLSGAEPSLRSLLEIAAVLGREVELALLCETSELTPDALQRSIADAVARGFLLKRAEARWSFSHVLVREAFYHELPDARRAALHARVVVALAGRVAKGAEEYLAPLAHHALAAVPATDATDAVQMARKAAERARSQLAYEEATSLLERALALCEHAAVSDVDRAEVTLALGWAATEAGQLERGRAVFRSAAQIARSIGNSSLFARAALGQGGEYVLGEVREELVDVLRAALSELGEPERAEERRLRARVLARLAAALTPSATPEEPLGLAREALRLAATESDARTRIDVDVGVGAALTDFARPEERIPVNERLLHDARAVGDRVLRLRALTRLCCDHMERGDLSAADAAIAARAALAESLGHPRYLWQTPLIRSMRAMPEGRFDDCEAEIAEARRIAAEGPDPNSQRCVELHRLTMLLVAGRPEALREQQPAALRVLDTLPDRMQLRSWITAAVASRIGEHETARLALASLNQVGASVMTARMARATMAEAAVLSNVPEVYERIYQTFSADDKLAGWGPFAFACASPIARLLAAIAFARGRREQAVEHCQRALAIAKGMDASAHLAWVHLTWGEGLKGRPDACEHLERSAELSETLRMPEVLGRARAALGLDAPREPSIPPPVVRPVFSLRRDGTSWAIVHAERSFRVKDVRGLGMLAKLVENADSEVHVLDLATEPPADSGQPIDLGDSGEMLDARAIQAYKARIRELREQAEEAEQFADTARAARLRYELDALTDQIAGAVGLGGRPRRSGAAAERARIVVQRRVREAIKKIADQAPELGRHLDWTVRTGTFCAYEPSGRRSAR